MNYRQWKKNYKKKNGVNPPLNMDKRKQTKVMRKSLQSINRIHIQEIVDRLMHEYTQAVGCIFDNLGKAFSAAGAEMCEVGKRIREL